MAFTPTVSKYRIPQDGFFDEFIHGQRGGYYFQIELIHGRQIAGGYYHYKAEARVELRRQLQQFLRSPAAFLLSTESLPSRGNRHKSRINQFIGGPYERPKLIASRSE